MLQTGKTAAASTTTITAIQSATLADFVFVAPMHMLLVCMCWWYTDRCVCMYRLWRFFCCRCIFDVPLYATVNFDKYNTAVCKKWLCKTKPTKDFVLLIKVCMYVKTVCGHIKHKHIFVRKLLFSMYRHLKCKRMELHKNSKSRSIIIRLIKLYVHPIFKDPWDQKSWPHVRNSNTIGIDFVKFFVSSVKTIPVKLRPFGFKVTIWRLFAKCN